MPIENTRGIVKRVATLARPYGRKRLLVVFIFSLFQGIMQVIGVTSIFPFLALAADPHAFRESGVGKKVMSLCAVDSDSTLLLLAGLFAILMLFLSNLINLLSEYVRARYVYGFGHWLRVKLLRKILSKPYESFLSTNTAELQKKIIGDVMEYTTGVFMPLLDCVARVATVVLLVITLFIVDPVIALVTGGVLGVFYGLIFKVFTGRRSYIMESLKMSNKRVFREVQQSLGGVKAVKVSCAEENFIKGFEVASKQQGKMLAYLPMLGNSPRYIVEPIAFGGLVILVLITMQKGNDLNSILPVVGVMALAGYKLLPSVQLLYGQLTQMKTMRHALDEVYEEFLLVESSPVNETTSAQFTQPEIMSWKNSVEFKNVSFAYDGSSRHVIDNLNVRIPKNSSLGISGETGCGKSTLVDLLLGLHLPSKGEILIDGEPLSVDNRRAWRMGIGYVPQEIFLIDASIKENVAFGIEEAKIDLCAVREACEAAKILEFIEGELVDGLDTQVGERGVKLSGGQRQRIGLARALYSKPSLLVLDEATSALDNETEEAVMEAIGKLSGKMTIVAIAHRLKTIESFDKHIELVNSRTRISGLEMRSI